jgi:hypothetical protein
LRGRTRSGLGESVFTKNSNEQQSAKDGSHDARRNRWVCPSALDSSTASMCLCAAFSKESVNAERIEADRNAVCRMVIGNESGFRMVYLHKFAVNSTVQSFVRFLARITVPLYLALGYW